MKSKVLQQIITMSKYGLLGVLLQCVFINLITAENINAQKSLDNVILTIELKGQKIEKIFSEIEKNTNFTFSYRKGATKGKSVTSEVLENKSLGYVLRHLSKETDLQFRRVDNNIFVKNIRQAELDKGIDRVQEADIVNISGKVTAENGEGLVGANVLIKGSTAGTVTDIDGNYKIQVDSEATLVFSYIGFIQQETVVGSRSVIDVTMIADAEQLSEVVVTALGVKREERAIGFATEKVAGKTIANSNANNVMSSLKGRVAGLQISDANGSVGGTSRIVIRGNSSLVNGKNQPLIIVDGVQMENEIAGRGAQSQSGVNGKDWGSGINNINPWDIEDVQVLKGPNGAALYGSRGANGVIIITTKKGTKSDGLGLDFNVSHMIIKPTGFREVQNIRGQGSVGYHENVIVGQGEEFETQDIDGTTYNLLPPVGFWGSGASWGPEMRGQDVLWWNGEVLPFDPQPNNIKDFFSTGSQTRYNLAFSSASDVGSVRVSMTRETTTPTLPNVSSHQNTLAINSSLNISKKVRADIAISYMNNHKLNSQNLGDNERSIGKNLTYNWPRSYKISLEQDNYAFPDGTQRPAGTGRPGIDADAGRPGNYRGYGRTNAFFWRIWNENETRDRNRLLGSIALTYDITDWLSLRTSLGLDLYNDEFEFRQTPTDVNGLLGGRYRHTLAKNNINDHTWILTATKDITEDIGMTAFVGGEHYQRSYYRIQGQNGNRNFVNPYLYAFNNVDYPVRNLSAFKNINNGNDAPTNLVQTNWVQNNALAKEEKTEKEVNSLFASISLDYKDWLYLDVTGRTDWSSTLPEQNRRFFYPSAQTSLVFTDAFQMEDDILSFGKVRVAWAKAGNDTDPYQLQPTFAVNSFGGTPTSTVNATIPAVELKSESSTSLEFGVDLRFLKGRAGLDFTYYKIDARDQILPGPLPRSSGFTSFRFNTGHLQNKGIELLVTGTPIKTPDLSWDVAFNMNINRNKILQLDEQGLTKTHNLGGYAGGNGPSVEAVPGEDFGTIMGWDYLYFDENNNGETDDSEKRPDNRLIDDNGEWYLLTEDRVPVGNQTPDWTGGLVNTLRYKNFTLSALLEIKQGGDVFSGSASVGYFMGQSMESLQGWNAEHGGLAWTDDNGTSGDTSDDIQRNDGVVKQGVYSTGEANDKTVPYWYDHLDTFSWGAGSGPVSKVVYDFSYIKLQELSLTWDLPGKTLAGISWLQNASISLVGRNLMFLKNNAPQGIDPSAVGGSGLVQGIEWGQLPRRAQYGFTLKTSF